MRQLRLLLILFSVEFLSCNSDNNMDDLYCQNSIYIKTFNAEENKLIDSYELYETTNYPEGIIMEIESVSNKYRFKDSGGRVCIPILTDTDLKYRKFVFVKEGYVYKEYYLKNADIDTILQVIPIISKVIPLKEKDTR